MNPLRIIQVGVGGMGRAWAEAVHKTPEWEAVAYVDINEENLYAAAKEWGMDQSCCFCNLDVALKNVAAEALLDITPQKFREDTTTKALKAGLHVLSEKPLSDTLESAYRILDVAADTGRIYMVNQNYRFQPEPRTIHRLLDEGKIGQLGLVDVEFYKGPRFPGSYRLSMDYPLLADMCIHHFDLMRYLLNSDVGTLFVKSFKPSWSWFAHDSSLSMIIEMENGAVVTYGGSWVAKGEETPWSGNWRFEGSEGGIYWREDKIYLSGDKNPLKEEELVSLPRRGIEYSLYEFYQAIVEDRESETSGKDNIKSLAVVFAAIDSAKKGQRVKVMDYLK